MGGGGRGVERWRGDGEEEVGGSLEKGEREGGDGGWGNEGEIGERWRREWGILGRRELALM